MIANYIEKTMMKFLQLLNYLIMYSLISEETFGEYSFPGSDNLIKLMMIIFNPYLVTTVNNSLLL